MIVTWRKSRPGDASEALSLGDVSFLVARLHDEPRIPAYHRKNFSK
jgi:hypothetical protein